ncbi:MAG: PepSY domain-containing protein [Negativicutes bacterium]|nr:PepSY domain-containing protein [Negativicutes bacterium]
MKKTAYLYIFGIVLAIAMWIYGSSNTYIGETKAQEIALKEANLKIEDVSNIDTTFVRNKRDLKYKIEFSANGQKYEYFINSETGAVIK